MVATPADALKSIARCLALALALIAGPASAAEVRVMISAGFFQVYSAVAPEFERATGNKLVTTRGPSMGDSPEAIPARLARGETAAAAALIKFLASPHAAPALQKAGLAPPAGR